VDTRLRILERQAQSSGAASDWEKYARALQRVSVGGSEDEVVVWVVTTWFTSGHQDGKKEIAIYATEREATGHVLNGHLDDIGDIAFEPGEMDKEWYDRYVQFTKVVGEGDYDRAWKLWPAVVEETDWEDMDIMNDYGIQKMNLARCGPDIPPTSDTMSIW
jgi:hypothetical protein